MKQPSSIPPAWQTALEALVIPNVPDDLRVWKARQLQTLQHCQFPHEKTESWKYTSAKPLYDVQWLRAAPLPAGVLNGTSPGHYQINNGHALGDSSALDRRVPHDDSGDGAPEPSAPFRLLNAVLCPQPLVLRITRGHVRESLSLDFTSDCAMHTAAPRTVIYVEPGADLLLKETVNVAAGVLHNASLDVFVEQGAKVTHIKQCCHASDALSVSHTRVNVAAGGQYAGFVDFDGAKLAREEFAFTLLGTDASVSLSGLLRTRERRHLDLALHILHQAGRTQSRTHLRGIAEDRSRLIFNGRIEIPANAPGVDAALTNKNLLLSSAAEINTKPELEIYTDDVRCSHGATVGQLNEEALYYLLSRGIEPALAQGLLKKGFVLAACDHFPDAELAQELRERLASELDPVAEHAA